MLLYHILQKCINVLTDYGILQCKRQFYYMISRYVYKMISVLLHKLQVNEAKMQFLNSRTFKPNQSLQF